MSTRRKFLFDLSALSLTALAAPPKLMAAASLPSLRRRSLEDLSCEAFAGQLNTPFRIYPAPGKSIEVTLDQVDVRRDPPVASGQRPAPDAGHEKFSLFFSGRRGEMIGQRTYTFEHEVLGRFECFIVPVATRQPHKIIYEMVCNRPRRAGV